MPDVIATCNARAGLIRAALDVLFEPGQVVEVRIPKFPRGKATTAGYFDDLDKLAAAASLYSGKAPGVYVTLNPVNPALLARYHNRMVEWAVETTADNDVLRRRWLPLDFDPARPAGISATDEEHEAALSRARECRDYLAARGWPAPVEADSGNGAHLLYRIDLPNTPEALALVNGCLAALAAAFPGPAVAVDVRVGNAARIWKLYGTVAAKGDGTADRPHRLSRLLAVPAAAIAVPVELLEALAAEAPAGTASKPGRPLAGHAGGSGSRIDVPAYLREHNMAVAKEGPWQGGHRWELERCPWNEGHTDGSAWVAQFPSGAVAAGCHHNGCTGKDWHALRELCEPGRRDRNGHARRPAAAAPAGERPWGKDVIRQHFLDVYQPGFRRGEVIYSTALGREVRRAEACFGADTTLIDKLLEARDCPMQTVKTEEGGSQQQPNRQAIPKFYKTWAPTAWGDLLGELKEEEEGAEIVESAAEAFRAAVASGFHTIVALGQRYTDENKKTQTEVERRSLIDWCALWARGEAWGKARSFLLWFRWRDKDKRELRIALRPELFTQVPGSPLARLGYRRFAALAELYGVGRSDDGSRASGQRAVELEADFVRSLLTAPGCVDGLTERSPLAAHASGEPFSVNSEATP